MGTHVDPAPSLPFLSPLFLRPAGGAAMADESLVTVVRSGDRRRSLESMRDQLAERLEAAEGKDAATISKELREVMRELEQIPTGKEVSTSDDLAARRAARIAKAGSAERAAAGE